MCNVQETNINIKFLVYTSVILKSISEGESVPNLENIMVEIKECPILEPRFTLSLSKNVKIFLEWLQSDSDSHCSVFRLQHTFIKKLLVS